jgi:hypothetical protein
MLRSEELTYEVWFRLKVVKFPQYQKLLKGEEKGYSGRTFVVVTVPLPSDTIVREKPNVRGLFWILLRFSGISRRVGWIVAGDNQPIRLKELAEIIYFPDEELEKTLFEPLKRLMDTGRIQLYLATNPSEDLSTLYENPENVDNSVDNFIGERENLSEHDQNYPDTLENNAIGQDKTEEDSIREREYHPEHHQDDDKAQVPSGNGPHTPQSLFMKAWNMAYRECWEKYEDYPATEHEVRAVKKAITKANLSKHVAYVAYYHRHDPKVGITDGKYPPTLDNFFKAVTVYSTKLKKDNKGWKKAQSWGRGFLQKNRPSSTKKS